MCLLWEAVIKSNSGACPAKAFVPTSVRGRQLLCLVVWVLAAIKALASLSLALLVSTPQDSRSSSPHPHISRCPGDLSHFSGEGLWENQVFLLRDKATQTPHVRSLQCLIFLSTLIHSMCLSPVLESSHITFLKKL